jgi:hypothetical protein
VIASAFLPRGDVMWGLFRGPVHFESEKVLYESPRYYIPNEKMVISAIKDLLTADTFWFPAAQLCLAYSDASFGAVMDRRLFSKVSSCLLKICAFTHSKVSKLTFHSTPRTSSLRRLSNSFLLLPPYGSSRRSPCGSSCLSLVLCWTWCRCRVQAYSSSLRGWHGEDI